jgi:CRISPR-associated exonuclease Cas4
VESPAERPARSGDASPADSTVTSDTIPISHLARAAYCPRQYYYAERDGDHGPPRDVAAVRDLAFEYEANRTATDEELRRLPIAVSPGRYRSNLASLAERDDYDRLAAPAVREAFLRGRDCHGVAHKVLGLGGETGGADGHRGAEERDGSDGRDDAAPPTPTVVSPGDPPPQGVWEPQRVRAVAVAKALAWEREREIPRALVEYPAHGVVRSVRLTTRNRGAYRRTLWTVRSMRGVPSRIREESKCDACDYRTTCGTKTRSLKTLLGLG